MIVFIKCLIIALSNRYKVIKYFAIKTKTFFFNPAFPGKYLP